MIDRQKFAVLRSARRVWAVGAVHGEVERLERLHAALWPRLESCDRIVYLGNMIGRGQSSRETLDCLLRFRLDALARPHRELAVVEKIDEMAAATKLEELLTAA